MGTIYIPCLDYGGNLQKISELATQEDPQVNIQFQNLFRISISSSVRKKTCNKANNKHKQTFPNNNLELSSSNIINLVNSKDWVANSHIRSL